MAANTKRSLAFVAIFAICHALASPALAMDMARAETRADLASAQFNLTGRGVIIGMLDRGIDWTNDDFRNDDGTTRIAYIFDLSDDSGAHAPGNTYGVGTIYTREQIDLALSGGPTIPFRDAVGHGTQTTGIEAGNGRNLPSRKYRGIAPEATLIVVKITGGAPAHDDQPAEPGFYLGARVPTGIDFVRDKARELGMPAVMLANVGSQGGPTDGTSALARKIDSTVGPGIPGLVFVTGPGDDGGYANRCGGAVQQGQTAAVQIKKEVASTLRFDLWYPESDRFDVSVQTPSGANGPYAAPATADDFQRTDGAGFTLYQYGANRDAYGAENDKREVTIDISGPAGTYTVNLIGRTVANGRFDGTLNPAPNTFLTYAAPGSIWDAAAAKNNICPGDYVIRTQWTDVDGVARSNTGQGNVGEIWTGSSVGPTFDGRLGVDVVAPGDSVFTTRGAKSYDGTFRFNQIQDGQGFYTRQNAVSAAAPQVTGIIALLLQVNPQLDAAQVKSILQLTARPDRFTGQVPNPTWGYGKVDAFGAVVAAMPGAKPVLIAYKWNFAKGSLAISGSGFVSGAKVFVDGVAFSSPAKVKNGVKVSQKGTLAGGKTLDQAIRPGQTVAIDVLNPGAGGARIFYARP